MYLTCNIKTCQCWVFSLFVFLFTKSLKYHKFCYSYGNWSSCCPILLITCMITRWIGLYSVLFQIWLMCYLSVRLFLFFFHLVALFYVMWLFFRKFFLLELVMIFLPISSLFHQKAVKIYISWESTGIMQFTVKEH